MPEGTEVRPDAGNSLTQRARATGSVAKVPGLARVAPSCDSAGQSIPPLVPEPGFCPLPEAPFWAADTGGGHEP